MYRYRINGCTRCNGTGYIAKWKHIMRGICFKCKGEDRYEKIKASIVSDGTALSGCTDLLYNTKALEMMTALLAEGFDDEILADFAHQMSKI